MKQFDLDGWLKNRNQKVITREGKSVRIICWDSPNKVFPIVGFIEGDFAPKVWDTFGFFLEGHTESKQDLFFVDETNSEPLEVELLIQKI